VSDLAGMSWAATAVRPLENGGAPDGVPVRSGPEDAGELDGVVGFSFEDAQRPTGRSSQIHVSAPDGPSGSSAIGLEDDLRILALAFAAGGAERCRELIAGLAPRRARRSSPSQQQPVDVHIALHGLELDPDDEEELRELIRMLVAGRAEGGARS
jgi:hypothetical protein